jgi:hypothetical protein
MHLMQSSHGHSLGAICPLDSELGKSESRCIYDPESRERASGERASLSCPKAYVGELSTFNKDYLLTGMDKLAFGVKIIKRKKDLPKSTLQKIII